MKPKQTTPVGEFVKRARARLNCSQASLADQVGVTNGAVCAWENGRYEPSYEMIFRLHKLSNEPMPMGVASIGGVTAYVSIRETATSDVAGMLQISPAEDHVPKQINSIADHGEYGIRIIGDGLSPRVRSAECVVVVPERTPRHGDMCLIELIDGRKTIKEFLYDRAGEITTCDINTGAKAAYGAGQIAGMHYIGLIAMYGYDLP